MNARPDPTPIDVSSAYAQFLEQLSNDDFWRLAVDTAQAAPAAQVPTDDYLECVLTHGRCLLPLIVLREIVSPPYSFSRFPATPAWMIGIGAWRGETIAVIDLDAYLFHHAARSPHNVTNGTLVVAQLNDLTLLQSPQSGSQQDAFASTSLATSRPMQPEQDYQRTPKRSSDLTLGFLVRDVGAVTALDVEQIVSIEQAATWYTHLQKEVVIGVKCDGGGSGSERQLDSEALLLDMPVLVHDIVQHLKSDRLS